MSPHTFQIFRIHSWSIRMSSCCSQVHHVNSSININLYNKNGIAGKPAHKNRAGLWSQFHIEAKLCKYKAMYHILGQNEPYKTPVKWIISWSQYDPFGPITFGRSRGFTWRNHFIPSQVSRVLHWKLARHYRSLFNQNYKIKGINCYRHILDHFQIALLLLFYIIKYKVLFIMQQVWQSSFSDANAQLLTYKRKIVNIASIIIDMLILAFNWKQNYSLTTELRILSFSVVNKAHITTLPYYYPHYFCYLQ